MRHTRTCPKCRSRKLFVIKEVHTPSGSTTYLTHDTMYTKPGDLVSVTRGEAGPVEAWVCAGCGFTELYAHLPALETLKRMSEHPKSDVKFIDGDAPTPGGAP